MFPVISDADQLTTVTTHAIFIVRPVVPFARCQKIKNKIFRKIFQIFFESTKSPCCQKYSYRFDDDTDRRDSQQWDSALVPGRREIEIL